MAPLSKDDILKYFGEINQYLTAAGKHGEILITGGAALTLIFDARTTTQDIDALFRPSEEMRTIIKRIADDHDLDYDWLNDSVKGFLTVEAPHA